MSHNTLGVDISKVSLDACRFPTGEHRKFPNTAKGHAAFLKWAGDGETLIVFEPTGPYHIAFELFLQEHSPPACKVNPRKARRFAEAAGMLAKTDRIDAAMLARMGAQLELQPQPGNRRLVIGLRQLFTARQALIRDQTAAKNRRKNLSSPLLKRQNKARLLQITTHLKALDAEIRRIINDDPDLARKCEILASVPGIALQTASLLLIEMPEIGTLNEKQIASLAGLAPMTRQSGRWSGKASIRGGRASVFMPALVATRFNPDLKAKYQALIKAGKPQKVAIVAVMRKLLICANALVKNDRLWTPKTA